MAKAALLLATEPLDKVTGRVTYSQEILAEFGWIDNAKGTGVDPGAHGQRLLQDLSRFRDRQQGAPAIRGAPFALPALCGLLLTDT